MQRLPDINRSLDVPTHRPIAREELHLLAGSENHDEDVNLVLDSEDNNLNQDIISSGQFHGDEKLATRNMKGLKYASVVSSPQS